MTKEQAKEIVLKFFKDTKDRKDAFMLTQDFLDAREVLGGHLSEEMNNLFNEAMKGSWVY